MSRSEFSWIVFGVSLLVFHPRVARWICAASWPRLLALIALGWLRRGFSGILDAV